MNFQANQKQYTNRAQIFVCKNEPFESGMNQKQKNQENLSTAGKKLRLQKKYQEQASKDQAQDWRHAEIKKIFTLYSEFGSHWKIIQTQFSGRSSNSIKNRFYTVVRTFLKILFRQHPLIKNKLPHEIPSKTILKFYEGRQQFIKFKGFGKKILKSIDYDLQSRQLKKLIQSNLQQIRTLYELVFSYREPVTDSKKPTKKSSNLKEVTLQNKNENKDKTDNQLKGLPKTETTYDLGQQINQPNFQIPSSRQNQIQGLRHYSPVNIVFMPTNNYFNMVGFPTYFSYL